MIATLAHQLAEEILHENAVVVAGAAVRQQRQENLYSSLAKQEVGQEKLHKHPIMNLQMQPRSRAAGRRGRKKKSDEPDDNDESKVNGMVAADGEDHNGANALDPAPAADEAKPRRKAAKKKTIKDDDYTEDEDAYDKKPRRGRGKAKTKQVTLDEAVALAPEPKKTCDLDAIQKLSSENPDSYWLPYDAYPSEITEPLQKDEEERGPIEYIDTDHPLKLLPYHMSEHASISGISLSPDGLLLATFSSTGIIRIWELETFKCVQNLQDMDEPNIFDEFFVGQFLSDGKHLVVGGKLKDRKRWSEMDEDNHILPCPLKIFNIITGKVVSRLDGHSEEILCIKSATYRGERYLLTTSQDGYINRWHMGEDWTTLIDRCQVEDGVTTCMSFGVSFVPNTGNRYFAAACDDHIKLMDMETCRILQSFSAVYSSYCDCGKFIELAEEPNCSSTKEDSSKSSRPFAYFITRGVELLQMQKKILYRRDQIHVLYISCYIRRQTATTLNSRK